jgi:hypothetical protein
MHRSITYIQTGRHADTEVAQEKRTKLCEIWGGESICIVSGIVVDREDGEVELLELHHVLVSHAVEGYGDLVSETHGPR